MDTIFRSLDECRPLLELASADLCTQNAFRIAGLCVDATSREITRHADRLKMRMELGDAAPLSKGAMPLQPPPTLHEIRAAIDSLKDPETRLTHEILWFWPEEYGNSRSDSAFQAWAAGNGEAALRIWTHYESDPTRGPTARHNLAVFWHMVALDRERDMIGQDVDPDQTLTLQEYWEMALKRWRTLVDEDRFWDKVTDRIHQIDDPRLSVEFGRRFRASLMEAFGKIHIELALRYLEAKRSDLASFHIALMRKNVTNPVRLRPLVVDLLSPVRARLREMIREVRDGAEQNPEVADAKAWQLVGNVGPFLEIQSFIKAEASDPLHSEFLDELASTVLACAMARQNVAPKGAGAFELLKRARELAASAGLVQQIDAELAVAQTRELFRPILDQLAKMRDSNLSCKSQVWRIRDQILPALNSLAAADPQGRIVTEMRDALASTLREIAEEISDQNQGWDAALVAVDLALSQTSDPSQVHQLHLVRRRIEASKQSQMEALQHEERRRALARLMDQLANCEADHTHPRTVISRIEQEVVPQIRMDSAIREDSEDCIAVALRKLSLCAWNEFGDPSTALYAIRKASQLAHDPDLQRRSEAEKVQAAEFLRYQNAKNASVEIREDKIEVSCEGVRINSEFLPAHEIVGIRFGAKQGRSSFLIEIKSSNSPLVEFDCHRLLRSKAQVSEDFAKITDALQTHIGPQIAARVAAAVFSTGSYPFFTDAPYSFSGEIAGTPLASVTRDFFQLAGQEPAIQAPYGQLKITAAGGILTLHAPANLVTPLTWSLGEVWNAVFFEQIVAAIQRKKCHKPNCYAR